MQPAAGAGLLRRRSGYAVGMPSAPAPRVGIAAASLAVYLSWGSAYLAMQYGFATVPPLLLAGGRLVLAGVLMTGYALLGGHRLHPAQLKPVVITGALLFLGGHGLLYWGQARGVPSGLAAVLYATIPLWVVLLEGLSPSGIRLGGRALLGLALGTVGVLLLVGPAHLLGGGGLDLAGAAAISAGSLFWALGSLYAVRAALPASAALAGGLEMFCGGVLLLGAALALGEARGFHLSQVSRASLAGVGYLVVVSSMVGFSCYLWLLKATSAARVSTYAYVTPLVAVGLGWALAGEPVTRRTAGAVALLLSAVALIVRQQSKSPTPVLAAELDAQGAVAP